MLPQHNPGIWFLVHPCRHSLRTNDIRKLSLMRLRIVGTPKECQDSWMACNRKSYLFPFQKEADLRSRLPFPAWANHGSRPGAVCPGPLLRWRGAVLRDSPSPPSYSAFSIAFPQQHRGDSFPLHPGAALFVTSISHPQFWSGQRYFSPCLKAMRCFSFARTLLVGADRKIENGGLREGRNRPSWSRAL